jgi:2,4-dienoyl-CoA reductase-like NADH-dependent reductase (Old Yellow Enzyme family)
MIAIAPEGQTDTLLTPIQLGPLTLRNRVVLTTHLAFFDAYHPRGDARRYATYVERRAAAGVAMISLQSLKVLPVTSARPFAYDYLEERLTRLAGAAHEHHCPLVIQLQHFGYKQGGFGTPDMEPLWAFEALRSPVSYELSHKMTSAEIESLVSGYAEAARFAVGCGIDGVELAGSHGYLLYQSLNTRANRRDDKWGSPMVFWRAVLGAVRDAIGSRAVLGARVCSDDLLPAEQGGIGRAALRDAAVEIVDTGLVDYLNPTEGADFADYGRVVGTFRRPHGDFLPSVRAMRDAIRQRVPVIGGGRVTSIAEARDALRRGDCDIVGMTRAHIADPDVLPKLRAGRADRTRPCIGANLCIDRTNRGQDIACFHNPDLNRGSGAQALAPAPAPKRIVVVGGGPAGIKTAETAARRGHHVTLLERAAALGGRLALLDDHMPAAELKRSLEWLERELAELGVDVRRGVEVSPSALMEAAADAIVLATGSLADQPEFPSDGSVPVWTMDNVPHTAAGLQDPTIVVYDLLANEESDASWEQLRAAGFGVVLMTPHPTTGAQLGYTHRVDHTARLHDRGCALMERTEVTGIREGRIERRSTFDASVSSARAGGVVIIGQRRPDLALYEAAAVAAPDVRLVGDSIAPRTAFQAFREGDALGQAL